MKFAEFSRDGDVAAPVAEANWGREIEDFLATARPPAEPLRTRNAEPAVQKICDQRVALCRIPAKRIVAATLERDEFGTSVLRHCQGATVRLDLIIITMND